MPDIEFRQILTEELLNKALDLCYPILGHEDHPIYCREAWLERFRSGNQPLVCAIVNGEVISAVLGRSESPESLILGFAACREDYRRHGITRRLITLFETLALDMGYRILRRTDEQTIYQKTLDQ